MRIVVDARMYGAEQTTGIGVYIAELVKELGRGSDEVIVLLPKNIAGSASFLESNIKVVPVDFPWYSWREQVFLPALLYRLKPDLVHFPQFNVPILYRAPFVVTIHDITPHFFPGPLAKKSWFRRTAYKVVFRHALRASRRIIAVSQHIKAQLVEHFLVDEKKIIVTPLGVGEQFKIIDDATQHEVLTRVGSTQPYLLYVGVWRDHKNIPGLIAAFDHLRQRGHNMQLVLTGKDDPRYPEITETIEKSKYRSDICLVGFVPEADIPSLYRAAAVVVIPSFCEGFGLTGVEAVACGTPVAASNTTSLPEVLGEAGHYFAPGDPVSITDCIEEMLKNPVDEQTRLRHAQNIRERYRWSTCARATVAVYQSARSVV